MNINRYNYEEYFILYLDNELDSEGRRGVETFAAANPDLKAELDMLMQSKLTPDTGVSFADKDSLMRFRDSSVSLNNYEEWLIAYIDDELSQEERKDAENFIAGNPSIQRELNLLQRAKLQPEAIVFPYKESLYRKEEKARVIAISWRRIAVAAALLLAISTTAIVVINNNKGNNSSGSVASNNGKQDTSTNSTAGNKPKEESVPTNSGQVTNDTDKKDNTNKKDDQSKKVQPDYIAKQQSKDNQQEEKKEQVEQKKNESINDVAINNNEKKTDKTIQTSIGQNPNNTADAGNATGAIDATALTKPKEDKPTSTVTTPFVDTYNKVDPSDKKNENSDVEFASQKNKGGGVRGFLRKVTRTFEKRTNIKATDDDDRLLVAGLAIKL